MTLSWSADPVSQRNDDIGVGRREAVGARQSVAAARARAGAAGRASISLTSSAAAVCTGRAGRCADTAIASELSSDGRTIGRATSLRPTSEDYSARGESTA